MNKQTWIWTESTFVEIDFPVVGLNPPQYLCYIDVRQAYTDSGWIYTPDEFDEFYLGHDGTEAGVIKAIKAEFGVTLKLRPDLGVVIFEIVDGV